MDSVDLSKILARSFEETTRIDQAFVELAVSFCLSVLDRDFNIALPSSYPIIDLDSPALMDKLSSGVFDRLRDYAELIEDASKRNEIAGELLGSPVRDGLLPRRHIIQVDTQEWGRRIVLEAEQFCLEMDDSPITHILATEIQTICTECWDTPIPKFCVIDSKYGQLRGSGIFSASHSLAGQGFFEPARGLMQGLWESNPRPTLEL